jgi:3-oxoacyl-[acyl-carrier-protein] synthase III
MSLIIKAIEYYLPETIVTNDDLMKEYPDWDLEKVAKKSGILQRHIVSEGETAHDLVVKACEKIFLSNNKAGVDGIIYCTQSPDYIMPPNAFLLHQHLSLRNDIFAFDFNHACTGYIYALGMAHAFFAAGMAKEILIVNADTYSKYINKQDRSTRVLFGDGAAVTLVRESKKAKGLIDISFGSSGEGYDKFWIPAGGLRTPKTDFTSAEISDSRGNVRSKNDIAMDGFGVWAFINSVAPKQIKSMLKKNGKNIHDVDQFIFHQASLMTLESVIKALGIRKEKVFINISQIGNTVSSSIPIAIKDAMDEGRIGKGSCVILSGFGVGLSYGTILMEL